MEKQETNEDCDENKTCTNRDAVVAATEGTMRDWQSGKSLIQCLHHVLIQEIDSDVTFIVGAERNRVAAHKFILACRSNVFYAMFNGLLNENGDVEIPDIRKDIFVQFLTYLYTDELNLTVESVVALQSVARKYMVNIVRACDKYVEKNISADNACFLLEESHMYAEEQIMEKCLDYIYSSAQKSLESESFRDLCSECLARITNSNELAVDENSVYNAVKEWTKRECVRQKITCENMRSILGGNLYTIRFPIMGRDFFLDTVMADTILTNDEIVYILNYMRDNKEVIDPKFNKRKRRPSPVHLQPSPAQPDFPTNPHERTSKKQTISCFKFGGSQK